VCGKAEVTAFTIFHFMAVSFFADSYFQVSTLTPSAFSPLHAKILVSTQECKFACIIADEAAKLCGSEEDKSPGTDATGAWRG
jgi:hypothetical protein